MKVIFLLAFLVSFISSSCQNNVDLKRRYNTSGDNKEYFADVNNEIFVCVERRDSSTNFYEFDKNKAIIKKCIKKSGLDKANCETYFDIYSANTDNKLGCQLQYVTKDPDSLISHYSSNFFSVDSVHFWKGVSPILDSITFYYPKHKFLLGNENSIINSIKTLNINVSNLSDSIDLDELGQVPKLFFNITIRSNGSIENIEYNSWGTKIYEKLIEELKDIIILKKIENYDILNHPVRTKRTVGVLLINKPF